MNERGKFYEADKPSINAVDAELQKKIDAAESHLATLAQVVGGDFDMAVKFGRSGEGSFFNPKTGEITLDPRILAEDKEYESEFVAGHEGGHRAITRSLEQIGVPEEKATEWYKKIGFGYANNCLEDCADNNWVGDVFPRFRQDSKRVYARQFENENTALTTPEINQLIARLGYVPKFVACGSEIIRQWATGASSVDLAPAVADTLTKIKDNAREYYQDIPGIYAREGERLKKSKDRWRIFFENIWPEFAKLVEMDIDEEKLRQLEDELRKKERGKGAKIDDKGEPARGELTDEMRRKLQEIFDKLPMDEKRQLEEAAKRELEKLDDALIKETRGKLAPDNSPPTHEEIKISAERRVGDETLVDERDGARQREAVENKKLSEALREKIEGDLGEYEKIYQEIAPLADEFYNRIHQIFLPKRHPQWQKGNPTGQRLDLAKVMQFQADRGLYDKIWERKTIPHKIDYRFTLLVDLSGSMQGEKIAQTFRGTILLAEVLNRLGLKTQIMGFQDEPILYKDFDEDLTPEKRRKITVMPREVENKGEHNQAGHNSDGYCLSEASKFLAEQKGKDNFLVIMSDGLPAPDNAHAGPEYDLNRVVARIRKNTWQKLIGVGLGPDTGHVSKYYPTSLPNLDIQQLPRVLGELLENMIKYPGRYQ